LMRRPPSRTLTWIMCFVCKEIGSRILLSKLLCLFVIPNLLSAVPSSEIVIVCISDNYDIVFTDKLSGIVSS
jgi:hypothetical protein